MKESTKTAAFVGSAVAMLLAAFITSYANQPQPIDDFETIGQSFYADFERTDQAKSLVVTSMDPDAIRKQKFEIKQVDGLWQIPSHEGYPAEAAERLANTSASLVGLTRDSLVGRRTSDYEKFGVIDPRTDDIVDIESVGQSITLRDANDDVLVDLIIGDRADDEDSADEMMGLDEEQSHYYVRRADETNVYRIPLDIELSTKFSDWIEPDLLQLEASDVVALKLNNYQIRERSSGMFGQVKELEKSQGDQLSITRASSTDDWEVEKVDAKTEKANQTAINAIVSVLDEMAILDVKKKPTLDGKILLDADLNYSVTPEQAKLMSIRTQRQLDALGPNEQAEFQALQMGIMELQRDLEAKGFSIGSTGRKIELVSAGGEMTAGTTDGLRYTLHVGKASTDTVEEIKVAGSKSEDSDNDKQDAADEDDGAEPEKKPQDEADGDKKSEEAKSEDQKKDADDSNRYVLIRVAFDDSLLSDPGEKPVEPKAPTKPEGYTEAADKDVSASEDSGDDKESSEEEASEDDEAAPKPDNMKRNPAFVKYDADLAAYETAKVDYEVALSTYQTATKEKEAQVETGKRMAEVLNGRFEKWYYVVSSENLNTLQSGRKELLEPVDETTSGDEVATDPQAAAKAAAEAMIKEAMEGRPDVSFPEIEAEKLQLPEDSAVEETKEIKKPAVVAPSDNSQNNEGSEEANITKEEPEPATSAPSPTEPTVTEPAESTEPTRSTEESNAKEPAPKNPDTEKEIE